MKNIGIFVSALAIAGGIVAGRLQYESEAGSAPRNDSDEPVLVYDPKIPSPEQDDSRKARNGRRGAIPDADPSGGGGETRDAAASSSTTPPDAVDGTETTGPTVGAPNASPRFEEIRKLIAEQKFAEAESLATTLAEEMQSGSSYETAARLSAKARVFKELIGTLDETAAAPSKVHEVQLANGNKITATEVTKKAENYVIRLANGATYSPRLEDVLAIKEQSADGFRKDEWRKLQPKLEKIDNPIDLYVKGVQKCYAVGLENEGLKLLERLLVHPDSDTIPIFFLSEGPEELVTDWRVAAGRLPPDARAEVATERPQTRPVLGDPTGEDSNSLVRASRLLGEAGALYRNAARKEGREGELRQARARLDEALDILEALPADDSVRKMRRQATTLLHDLIRVSPF